MEGSRMRTLLGAGLVLFGGLLLLRAFAAPVAFVRAPIPSAQEVEELTREQQRAQIEFQRARLEAQRELDRAQMEVQRELNEAQANAAAAEIPPLPALPAVPPLPPLPPVPPLPPLPPADPLFHIGAWINPPLVLVALLALLLWRRGQRDRAPRQV